LKKFVNPSIVSLFGENYQMKKKQKRLRKLRRSPRRIKVMKISELST